IPCTFQVFHHYTNNHFVSLCPPPCIPLIESSRNLEYMVMASHQFDRSFFERNKNHPFRLPLAPLPKRPLCFCGYYATEYMSTLGSMYGCGSLLIPTTKRSRHSVNFICGFHMHTEIWERISCLGGNLLKALISMIREAATICPEMSFTIATQYSIKTINRIPKCMFNNHPLCQCGRLVKYQWSDLVDAWTIVCPTGHMRNPSVQSCNYRVLFGRFRKEIPSNWRMHGFRATKTTDNHARAELSWNQRFKNKCLEEVYPEMSPFFAQSIIDNAFYESFSTYRVALPGSSVAEQEVILGDFHNQNLRVKTLLQEIIETHTRLHYENQALVSIKERRDKAAEIARESMHLKWCKMCSKNEKNALCIPCHHIIVCFACAGLLKDCPSCGETLQDIWKIYRV
ncbi:Death-associated inhibitor of apoptosis 1, partial [Neolecta irregularis DAH-3]